MRIGTYSRPMLATVACLCALAIAPSAQAAEPTGEFAPFKACPYADPEVQSCLIASGVVGDLKLGKVGVSLSEATPITLQGAYSFEEDRTTWFNAAGGFPTLDSGKFAIAGGIQGLFNNGKSPGKLAERFGATAPPNAIFATAELAGPVQFDLIPYLYAEPSFVLPLKVHIENPLLGPNCYLGSDADPIVLRPTTGTTEPPPGIAPLIGSPGKPTTNEDGSRLIFTDHRIVDNAFSVPGATGCGTLPLSRLVLGSLLNERTGLPAVPGESEFSLEGPVQMADRKAVLASAE